MFAMATKKFILVIGAPLMGGVERYLREHALAWRLHVSSDLDSELDLGYQA